MDRNLFNKSHYSFAAGQLGQLQTISTIPVIAGDSVTINMQNLMRLSPLRRTLLMDAQVDYFMFFVPQRHIYGDDWETMIKEGNKNSTTFTEIAIGSDPGDGITCMGVNMIAGSGPYAKFLFDGYHQIWNRYFRFLKLTPEVPMAYDMTGTPSGHTVANSPLAGTAKQRAYGYNVCRLKKAWNTGLPTTIVAADTDAVVGGGGTTLDIIDLQKTKKFYKTELQREYFSDRYSDVMKQVFGAGVNTDADERPTLLQRVTKYVSGHDVDGTDDANLGTFAGKAISGHHLGLRRKFFNEHGTIWIMCVVRFPTIAENEVNPLYQGVTDQYLRFSGDYNTTLTERPFVSSLDEWMTDGSGAQLLGTIPYGQWWRENPSYVQFVYNNLLGFPFLNITDIDSHRKAVYHHEGDYTAIFQTEQLAQWQNQAAIHVESFSHYPTTVQSIMVGT